MATDVTMTAGADDAPRVDESAIDTPSPLEALISRAQASAEHQSTNKRNKALIHDLAIAVVSLARMNADMAKQLADKPRIIVP